jgi:2,5-diketo-D-gluconate reductase B
VYKAGVQALDELGLDYLDLYLIHWPVQTISISETLLAMNTLKKDNLIKHIGISNFNIKQTQEAINTGVKIDVNQVEFHPSLNQKELLTFCNNNDIILTTYSPLARGEDLKLQPILQIANEVGKTPSQVILKWLLQHNIVVIPKSQTESRIKENFELFDWNLSEKQMRMIDKLKTDNRLVNPGFANF